MSESEAPVTISARAAPPLESGIPSRAEVTGITLSIAQPTSQHEPSCVACCRSCIITRLRVRQGCFPLPPSGAPVQPTALVISRSVPHSIRTGAKYGRFVALDEPGGEASGSPTTSSMSHVSTSYQIKPRDERRLHSGGQNMAEKRP